MTKKLTKTEKAETYQDRRDLEMAVAISHFLGDTYKAGKNRQDAVGPKYARPVWAKEQIIRMSGLVEDICEHGVGHPNMDWLAKHDPEGKKMFGVHGCDGCCMHHGKTIDEVENEDS